MEVQLKRDVTLEFTGGTRSATTEVTVYELSNDLRTLTKSYILEGVALAGWWVPGENILLDGGPIWSLTKEAPLEAASRIVSSQLSPDSQWRAEVIGYAGCFRG
jgi:hypothetical protein